MAKKTYEALNAQLLDELPKLYSLCVTLFDDCVRNFVNAQREFMESAQAQFIHIVKVSKKYLS